MIKKNLLMSIVAIGGLMSSLQASAADNNWYAGASLGTTTIETGVSNTTGTAQLDEEDSGFKIFFGKKITKTIAVEGFYADFGEASLTGNNGDNFTIDNIVYVFTTNNASIKSAATGFGANAKFFLALGKSSSIVARLGLLRWDVDTTVSGASVASTTLSDSGTDIFYGLGYQYSFNDSLALSLDYDLYEIDDSDTDMITLGVVYNF